MSNNISIRNIDPQQITISGAGQPTGITNVYVNGVDVTVGTKAYVLVPTNNNELLNGAGYITAAEETDPTVPSYVKAISLADINSWNDKQDQLVSGSNIKTINNTSLLGSGDIEITATDYVAGTGIDITDNTISNTITSYQDLTDTPTIPTKTSDLINDSGFITNSVNDLQNYLTTEVLEDILPHTSDSGTGDLYLEDSVKYKIKMELNPSEIEQHTTTGKNLFTTGTGASTRIDIDATYNGSEVILNGTSSGSGNIFYDAISPLNTGYRQSIKLPAGTYTLSTSTTGSATYPVGVGIAFYIRDDNANIITSFSSINNYQTTITLNDETQIYSQMYINGSGGVYDNYSIHLQIEQGSTATAYEEFTGGMPSPNPLYPQDIHVTSGENSITIVNKNICDSVSANSTISSSGVINWNTGPGYLGTTKLIKVTPSTEYTITFEDYKTLLSYNLLYGAFDKEQNFIERVSIGNNLTFTTGANTYYILPFLYNGGGIFTTTGGGIQIEHGSTATSFVPYQSQEYPIDLSDFLTYWGNNDICKITSPYGVYETVIFLNSKDHRYHNEDYSDNAIIYSDLVQKVILDGTENWILSGGFFETSIGSAVFGSSRTYAISNYFTDKSKAIDTVNESWIWTNGPFIDIHLSPSLNINTVEDFITWLSNNNVIIYAIKGAFLPDSDNCVDGFAEEDPVYQEYRDLFDNSTSYDGGTNISQENFDLPFDINASTFKKIN